ncbi:cupin domain-containing protein [Motilimonas pumila]|uniref:cupin domain-containing protein n=1 Tax=Motilimonas pumila TaxID=2303987 RepID=UPI001314D20E|nr:cupin domain-containing protein [Motilimonas pumila]
MPKLNIDIDHFLSQYWQKKPLFVKQGIVDFVDPISAEEMAGLAMEPEVQSRLVSLNDGKWQAECGPFQDFSRLAQDGATLLNQAVNHWHEPSASLVKLFHFIPNWRFDDLMISYSTPKGGVGPHIDQYCVFIIQGQGKRHWRVGEKQDLAEFTSDKALKHCGPFEACIDVVMEPGDILYIPPGCPHEGYAVEAALNYSVGFRAPDQKELLNDFTDHLLQQEACWQRYSDPELTQANLYGEISRHESDKLSTLLQSLINQPEVILPFFGQHFSSSNHELDILPLTQEMTADTLHSALLEGAIVRKVPGLKFIYLAQRPNSIFVAGEQYDVSNNQSQYYRNLCNPEVQQADIDEILASNDAKTLLTWFTLGYLFLD